MTIKIGKLDQQAIDALKRPDTKVKTVELTPEKKAKFKLASDEIIVVLKKYTDGPLDAYILLRLIQEGFEETYDIRGSTLFKNKELEKGD